MLTIVAMGEEYRLSLLYAQAAGRGTDFNQGFCPKLLIAIQMVPVYYCTDEEEVFEVVCISCWY